MEQIKRYRVVEDLQGGDFGMNRDYTVEQWRAQAITWAKMDESDGIVDELSTLPPEKVIDYIADFWQLEFAEIKETASKQKEDFGYNIVRLEKLNATIYIDKWRENADKIRVYDSHLNYLSYYEPDTIVELTEQDGVSEQQWLDKEAKDLANISDIHKLLDCLGVRTVTVAERGDLSPIIKNFAESYDYDNQLTDMGYESQLDWLRQNEWINFIGDYIIHVVE